MQGAMRAMSGLNLSIKVWTNRQKDAEVVSERVPLKR